MSSYYSEDFFQAFAINVQTGQTFDCRFRALFKKPVVQLLFSNPQNLSFSSSSALFPLDIFCSPHGLFPLRPTVRRKLPKSSLHSQFPSAAHSPAIPNSEQLFFQNFKRTFGLRLETWVSPKVKPFLKHEPIKDLITHVSFVARITKLVEAEEEEELEV